MVEAEMAETEVEVRVEVGVAKVEVGMAEVTVAKRAVAKLMADFLLARQMAAMAAVRLGSLEAEQGLQVKMAGRCDTRDRLGRPRWTPPSAT